MTNEIVRDNHLTVISWATPSYVHLSKGLQRDCERLGYPFHLYLLQDDYSSLTTAWCNHPRIVREGIREFGRVLFLDVECRILRAIPSGWRVPSISVRKPAQQFWIKYNSGTVLADSTCIPWIDAWIKLVSTWNIDSLRADDFIHWPGDICDELALCAALDVLNIDVNAVDLEYVDRESRAEISRGCWSNDHTIIQHSTIHHWPNESDSVECKKLFWQNYPGDPTEASEIFRAGTGILYRNNWVFDSTKGFYAPEEFFSTHPRPWVEDKVQLTSGQH
jgi:hypothetical protein